MLTKTKKMECPLCRRALSKIKAPVIFADLDESDEDYDWLRADRLEQEESTMFNEGNIEYSRPQLSEHSLEVYIYNQEDVQLSIQELSRLRITTDFFQHLKSQMDAQITDQMFMDNINDNLLPMIVHIYTEEDELRTIFNLTLSFVVPINRTIIPI